MVNVPLRSELKEVSVMRVLTLLKGGPLKGRVNRSGKNAAAPCARSKAKLASWRVPRGHVPFEEECGDESP